jgi:hypothetical protein
MPFRFLVSLGKEEIGRLPKGVDMSTHKQITANKTNSLKSTGPNSFQGKSIVSQNAIKHGILSSRTPIDEEEREEFGLFATQLYTSLLPMGELEQVLVDRIISNLWRLRRIVHIEGLMLKKSANESWETKTYQEIFEGCSGNAMGVLSRYERTLENGLFRALHELRTLKGHITISMG